MEEAGLKDGFNLAWCIPLQRELAKLSLGNTSRTAEDLVGESDERKTKMSTNFYCETSLPDLQTTITTLANTQLLAKMLVDVSGKGPLLSWAARALIVEVSGLPFRRRLQLIEDSQPQMYHAIFVMMEQFINKIVRFADRPCNIRYAKKKQWDKLEITILLQAIEDLTEHIRRLRSFVHGTDVMFTPQIWVTSAEKKTLDRIANEAQLNKLSRHLGGSGTKRKALGADTNNSKQTKVQDGFKNAADRVGCLNWTGVGRLPMPNGLAKPACGAELRQDFYCRFGKECKFDHRKIDALPVDQQKIWCQHVASTSGLEFNRAVCKLNCMDSVNEKMAAKAPKKEKRKIAEE